MKLYGIVALSLLLPSAVGAQALPCMRYNPATFYERGLEPAKCPNTARRKPTKDMELRREYIVAHGGKPYVLLEDRKTSGSAAERSPE